MSENSPNAALPAGWVKEKLGNVAMCKSGGTPSRGRPDYYRGAIPWVKIEDLTASGKWIQETTEFVSEAALTETTARLFPPHTVLFAMYGSIGTCSIASIPVSTNQAILGCTCGPRILPEYLWAWFTSEQKRLLKRGRGGTQANLNAEIVKSLEVPLPPLSEQKRIVAILNEQMAAVDKARAAAEAQLEAAKALPAAYLREVFPKGEPGKAPLPDRWKWVRVGELGLIQTGGTPSRSDSACFDGVYPWIKPEDLDYSTYVDRSSERLTEKGAKTVGILPAGSVLVSCIGKIGKISISSSAVTTNQQINSIVPSEGVSPEFIYYALRRFKDTLIKECSVSLVPILNKSSFSSILIPLPPLSEQKRIAAVLNVKLNAAAEMIGSVDFQLSCINALPAAFLRQAFQEHSNATRS